MTYVHNFLTSLVFTTSIETVVLVLLVLYVFRKQGLQLWQVLFAGFLGSFSTIPYVWFVFPYVVMWPRTTSLYFSEPFAFIAEAVIYRMFLKLDWKYALLASLLCNLASFLLGPVLRAWGIWIYW